MRRPFLFALALTGLCAASPLLAGGLPFHSLSFLYDSRSGMWCGLSRADSLAGMELRTGVLYGGDHQAAVQFGVRRWLAENVTATVAISQPMATAPESFVRDAERQYHADVYWKDLVGVSLDGKGRQQQATLNLWIFEIPIAGRVDGVPWVLR